MPLHQPLLLSLLEPLLPPGSFLVVPRFLIVMLLAAFPEDYISNVQRLSEDIVKNVKNLKNDALKYAVKEYKVELKLLYSAFELRPFAITTLRSFLMFYLPLLEPATSVEEDDEDFLKDTPKEQRVDLVVPFKKSVKQIIRKVLERLAVIYVSQRMVWKLLKDVLKSAVRKSQRGLPTTVYFFRVQNYFLRSIQLYVLQFIVCHLLGVVAAALVQTGIEIYRCFYRKTNSKESDEVNLAEQTKLLGKKIFGITIRCGASLIFASIGARIGAVLFYP
ncbi:hypothetical protein J1N35_025811 [Gossypium stocksii]|uniref:Uncharacterized protein n=1 Tax=Gossypium stocksii TaxID=47602 RepID=A0A9D3V9N0_9ROSI|nr:hypothetical protein J1N35_025811 [Gossypium stocksii]